MKLKQTVEQVEDAAAMFHGDEEAQLEMLILKQTVEQVEDAVAMFHGDEEAQLEMLESMLDSYPEGHPISEAAYLVGEKMGLL